MKPKNLLSLNLELINLNDDDDSHHPHDDDVVTPYCTDLKQSGREAVKASSSWSSLSESCWRQEGFSIGPDFLRWQGRTITRGQLVPFRLTRQHILGRGAFSTVHQALWRRPVPPPFTTTTPNKQPRLDFLNGTGGEEDDVEEVAVAVKEFSIAEASPQRRQMLLKELRLLVQVTSSTTTATLDYASTCGCASALVQMHGAFLDQDTVTVVLELMDQGSLEQVLQNDEGQTKTMLPEPVIAALVYEILQGLAYLHHKRILHRDLKPGNILLHSDGSVKLADFGLASLLADPSSMTMAVVGTCKYMAPERLRAKPYGRPSDVWSAGWVFRQMATGQPPWPDVASLVDLVVTVEEARLEDLVPAELDSFGLREIVQGCLQLDPAKRIPARLLLLSPWFTEEHCILSMERAMSLIRSWLRHKPITRRIDK